jgi:hypothetical protein
MVFEINIKYFVVAHQQWGQDPDQDQQLSDKRIRIPTLSGTHSLSIHNNISSFHFYIFFPCLILSIFMPIFHSPSMTSCEHDPRGVYVLLQTLPLSPSPGSLLITMNHRPTFSKLGLPPLGTVSASPSPSHHTGSG